MPLVHCNDTLFFVCLNNLIGSVAIRGDHQDEAVLCTDKATFDLKVAETSNSLLLVPHCALPRMKVICPLSSLSIVCLFLLSISCKSYSTLGTITVPAILAIWR